MKIAEKYSYEKVTAIHKELLTERSEWEAEWRELSQFLIPGRGIYQTLNKPKKRELTSPKVINPTAEDALYVLTSGLHARLSSPSSPWFRLAWKDRRIREYAPLQAWLQDCESRLQTELQSSNFYGVINSYYVEFAGFGTASQFVEEIWEPGMPPFAFQLLTAGEYSFSMSHTGVPSVYVRTLFKSKRQLVEEYPKTVSPETKSAVERNEAGIDRIELCLLEFICKEAYKDKAFTRILYEVSSPNQRSSTGKQKPLAVEGFYEHPYVTSRWSTIGSDTYGVGPGARSLSSVKRLQEMEKGFMSAVHKGIDPPLNVPAALRGVTNTLPGGLNYYTDPSKVISNLYQVNFDYQAVSAAVERVEDSIKRAFFNDVFLTASRDPNASPLKAAQVIAQQQEQLFRLGPTIESLQSETFKPLLKRCFNIMERRDLFQELPPELRELAGEFEITIVSPMAVAQRQAKTQGTDAFLGFIAQSAQFDQTVLDNVDIDEAAQQRAEVEAVDIGIVRPREAVLEIRAQRQKQLEEAQRRDAQTAQAQNQAALTNEDAAARKTNAETGQILAETQQTSREAGVL